MSVKVFHSIMAEICTICGESNTKNGIKMHMLRRHGDPFPFDICSKVLNYKTAVKQHKVRVCGDQKCDESLEKMKLKKKSYVGGDVLKGIPLNYSIKILKNISSLFWNALKNTETLEKFKRIWIILTSISKGLRKPNKNDDENEAVSRACEEFGDIFPTTLERNQGCIFLQILVQSGWE